MFLLATLAQPPAGDPGVDLLTIVVSLVVGLGGGVLSALVTTGAQRKIARSSARTVAATALWTFQRTLHDYAMERESHYVDDGSITLTKTTPGDIAAARALAYPHKNYLGDDAQLVERHWHAEGWPGDNPLIPSDDVAKWSKDLEAALRRVFGDDPK